MSIPCRVPPPSPRPSSWSGAETSGSVILYWYQLHGGTIGSDHLYRARLMWNRIVHRRADGALIRVASAAPPPAEVRHR